MSSQNRPNRYRREDRIIRYKRPRNYNPVLDDAYAKAINLITLFLVMAAFYFRSKLCSWGSVFCACSTYAVSGTQYLIDKEYFRGIINTSIAVAFMSLVILYIQDPTPMAWNLYL